MTTTANDKQAFATAMGRVQALHAGRKLAQHFEEALYGAGYRGPTAVAGGYLRDIALARDPKDLDIFLDGGHVPSMEIAKQYALAVVSVIKGARVAKMISGYGAWAEDIVVVVNIDLDVDHQEFLWVDKCAIPTSIDLVVLKRDRMVEAGYEPRLTNDSHNQEMFLKACLRRVDLRLNAIGATSHETWAHPDWDFDAYYTRLVIQHERREGTERIQKRLDRLLGSKYKGWAVKYECEDGSVSDTPVHVPADEQPESAVDSVVGLRDGWAAPPTDEAPLPSG